MSDPYYSDQMIAGERITHWTRSLDLIVDSEQDTHDALRAIVAAAQPLTGVPSHDADDERESAIVAAADAIREYVESEIIPEAAWNADDPGKQIISSFLTLGLDSVQWATIARSHWNDLREAGVPVVAPCLCCYNPTNDPEHVCSDCRDGYTDDDIRECVEQFAPFTSDPKPRIFRYRHTA